MEAGPCKFQYFMYLCFVKNMQTDIAKKNKMNFDTQTVHVVSSFTKNNTETYTYLYIHMKQHAKITTIHCVKFYQTENWDIYTSRYMYIDM